MGAAAAHCYSGAGSGRSRPATPPRTATPCHWLYTLQHKSVRRAPQNNSETSPLPPPPRLRTDFVSPRMLTSEPTSGFSGGWGARKVGSGTRRPPPRSPSKAKCHFRPEQLAGRAVCAVLSARLAMTGTRMSRGAETGHETVRHLRKRTELVGAAGGGRLWGSVLLHVFFLVSCSECVAFLTKSVVFKMKFNRNWNHPLMLFLPCYRFCVVLWSKSLSR